MDDTLLSATVDISLEVPPGPPLKGSSAAPLLQIRLPEGATLSGVDPESEALGLIPQDDGGFDVTGPLPPGTTSLGYAFRMPTTPQGVDLNLRFPAEVSTLNILIADTGVALDSGRLHRRRPFRSGKRNFLHREAFNVSPNEIIDLQLKPLSDTDIPKAAATALTLAAAVAGALFLIAPLRGPARHLATVKVLSPIAVEREAVYSSIRDLDHDFETGKLEAPDYERMRGELRTKAIDLLRQENQQQETPSAAATKTPADSTPTQIQPANGAFCSQCGGATQTAWKFCSHCGAGLEDRG